MRKFFQVAKVFLWVIVLAMLPLWGNAAGKNIELTGFLMPASGDTLDFRVLVTETNGKLEGYTITDIAGRETKTRVTGFIDHKKHTLTLDETSIVYTKVPPSGPMLLIHAVLAYTTVTNAASFSGTFAATDSAHTKEKTGTVTLYGIIDLEQWDTPRGAGEKKPAVPQPSPNKEPHGSTTAASIPAKSEITKGTLSEYNWQGDTVVLEIWDGGKIDGDVVTLLYNNVPVLTRYELVAAKKILRIPHSVNAIDTLTIIAENEGSEPPNTANVLLVDGDIKYAIVAYNDRGDRAIVKLKKVSR